MTSLNREVSTHTSRPNVVAHVNSAHKSVMKKKKSPLHDFVLYDAYPTVYIAGIYYILLEQRTR